MKFSEFMAAIRKGELPHVFLLSGEEPYYIDKAKEALLGKLFPGGAGMADALQKVSGDMAIDDLLASIEAAPFFADKNVILIAGTNLFRESKAPADSKAAEALVRQFGDMPPYSYLIFVAPYKADKRRKLYKALAKRDSCSNPSRCAPGTSRTGCRPSCSPSTSRWTAMLTPTLQGRSA